MTKYPNIYHRRNDQKVQVWYIEQDGGQYRVHQGIIDGKIVTYKWTVCTEKNVGRSNETSIEEQAAAEIKSLYTQQLETGYFEKLEDIDLQQYPIPMLAKNINDYWEEVDYENGVYSQPKLDGLRCSITHDFAYSRKGKIFLMARHIQESLKPLFKEYPNLVLDGELYADKYKTNFNKICSLIKKTKPEPKDYELAEQILFNCYDYHSNDVFSKRYTFIYPLIEKFKYITTVPTVKVTNREQLDKLYYDYMEAGYEGQIVRLDKSYQHRRTSFLLKRKEFMDDEFTVLGVEEGIGNRTGTVGKFFVRGKNGEEFKSNIKGSFTYLTKLWNDKDSLIGKTVTIKFFTRTPAGIPRFPYVIKIGREDYE